MALKKRDWKWNIAVRYQQKLQKQTQGNGESQKKLAATHRGMICRAGVAQCKDR
jgi:hypothetical protein